MWNRNSKQADFLSFQVCRRQMGSLTSVRKIWELCFRNVSQALQPDSIPQDLWLWEQGKETGGPCDFSRGTTPMQRPWAGAEVPSVPHCSSGRHTSPPLRSGRLLCPRVGTALWGTNHWVSSHFVSGSSPINLFLTPLTLQNLKC